MSENREKIEALASSVKSEGVVYVTATREPTSASLKAEINGVFISILDKQTFGEVGVICTQAANPSTPWSVFDAILRCVRFSNRG